MPDQYDTRLTFLVAEHQCCLASNLPNYSAW